MRVAKSRPMTVAAVAAAVVASLAGVSVSLWIAVVDHQSVLTSGFNAAVVVAFAATGAVIAAARPDNRVGWVMLVAGTCWALGGAGADVAHHGLVKAPGSVADAGAYAVGGSAIRSVGWYLVTLVLPTIFPDGRLAIGGRRWLPRVLAIIVVASIVDPLTDKQADLINVGHWHNPIAPTGAGRLISGLAFLGHVPLSLVATVGVIGQLRARWRNGDALMRQRLTLFLGAAVLPVIAVPIVFGVSLKTGSWIFGAAALPLPIAIGVAVLARGLYDLRTAANRTLVWLTLSAVIAGVYALVIGGVGSRFDAGGTRWLPWVAAAVVAVSFGPLRDGLQRGVNRLTFGQWDEPYDVLAKLGQRLEASSDVNRLLADVVTQLQSLGLRAITVRDLNRAVVAGEAPSTDSLIEQPLLAFGQPIGALQYQAPATPIRARDRRLLDDLAGHLGGVLHAHQLTLDLQRSLERQVLAREEERRRLRRDLHDGLGPSLAGHLLRLDLIARKVGERSPATSDIARLQADLRATVLEIRRVVEGLRPPALDELGLVGALSQLLERLAASNTVTVSLDVSDLPPLSAAIEVAAYRIVAEAVTNVVRHADATACQVTIDAPENRLRICVVDDGRGISHNGAALGHGLQTMRERAEELRGQIDVSAVDGTRIVVELPCAQLPGPAGRQPASEDQP